MGSGKTTASTLLHTKLQDTARLSHGDIKKYISNFGENVAHSDITQEVIMAMVEQYLQNNINIIAEWVMKKKSIESLKRLADKTGAQFFIYELTAPEDTRLARVKERTRILLGKEQLAERNIENIDRNFKKNTEDRERNKSDKGDVVILNSAKLRAEEIVEAILQDIQK